MKIYQSFLGEEQRAWVASCAIPYDVAANTGPNQREYEVFKAVHAQAQGDPEPWGVVSWKFEHKSLVPLDAFAAYARPLLERGHDCVFINPMIGNEAVFLNVWEQGEITHRGMKAIYEFLRTITLAPAWAPMGAAQFAFCNYFVANRRFWTNYFSFVDYVLGRLQSEAEGDSAVGALYTGPANYARDPSLTMRPFIIERLFSSFAAIATPLRIAAFPHPPERYRAKFGDRLGGILHGLSALKNRAIAEDDKAALRRWHDLRAPLLQTPAARSLIFDCDDPPPVLFGQAFRGLGEPARQPPAQAARG